MEELIRVLDYFGVVVFAVSGALTAARKGMDLVGFALIGTITGIGGGTLRDLLLDRPVFWLSAHEYVLLTLFAAWSVFFFGRAFTPRLRSALDWADAVGLSAFAVIGAQAALASGTSPLIAVIMGMMTASFGGLLRDMICGEPPLILHREVYASAAAAGAAVFTLLHEWPAPPVVTLAAGFGVALGLRGLGIIYGLHLPAFPQRDPGR